ncbi:hypothetical protein BG000_007417 [Podila horticola]|nr:hypothetical protein BG000_007417 [Podila horticola]
MILMYLVLALCRPHFSNLNMHSGLRVVFALGIIAGLVYSTVSEIKQGLSMFNSEKDEFAAQNDDGYSMGTKYSFAEEYFCKPGVFDDVEGFGFGFYVGELGKDK